MSMVGYKLDREYLQWKAVRFAMLLTWSLLIHGSFGLGSLLAEVPPPPGGYPVRRRQPVSTPENHQEPQTAIELVVDNNVSPPNQTSRPGAPPIPLPPSPEAGEEVLPINLPAAMRLADIRAWDIGIAVQQLRIAAAQLEAARVLWIPNIIGGAAYLHHDGAIQNITPAGTPNSVPVSQSITNGSFSSMYDGIAPLAVFASTDAIFMPLAQRQVTRAQRANVQTATNDTLTSLAVTYFNAVEARADLAGIDDVVGRMDKLVSKIESLAPNLVPTLEVARVKAALASTEEIREVARRRWRFTSAEVARVLRLKPTVLIAPLESPLLQVTLIPPWRPAEELIPLAVQNRPELAYNQAQVQAARHRLTQERWRPFLPIFLVRGSGSPYPYPLAFGAFGGGPGGTLSNFNVRGDWDVEAIWQLNNLGLGNLSLVRTRRADLERARIEALKIRDVVTKEVMEEWANLQSASRRVVEGERELRQALTLAVQDLRGLGEVKRVAGNIIDLVIRPLDVVVAIQALYTAYSHYFGAIADYNRSQFRLYRALGNPAQALAAPDDRSMPQSLPLTQP